MTQSSIALTGAVSPGQLGIKETKQQSFKRARPLHTVRLICNLVNFTIYDSCKPKWKEGLTVGICINGKGTDPGALLLFQKVILMLQAASHRVFLSFYEKIKNTPPPILPTTKNLFLALAETIHKL